MRWWTDPGGLKIGEPFSLISSGGNQCALVVDAFSPCRLEIEGKPVEWRGCPVVDRVRLSFGDSPDQSCGEVEHGGGGR